MKRGDQSSAVINEMKRVRFGELLRTLPACYKPKCIGGTKPDPAALDFILVPSPWEESFGEYLIVKQQNLRFIWDSFEGPIFCYLEGGRLCGNLY